MTGACDVYSLALVLYEAWTGSNPVRAQSPAATARRVGRPLPSLRSRRRDLPPELCEVVDAALDPDPSTARRPRELRQVLREVEPELSDGGRPGGARDARALRHHRRARRAPACAPCCTAPARRADARGAAGARAAGSALGPRLLAGAGAGALVLVALESLGPTPPVLSRAGGARPRPWRWRSCRGWAGWRPRPACACGWPVPRPAGRAPPWSSRGAGGRAPAAAARGAAVVAAGAGAPCWGRSPWRRCSWRWPGSRPRRGAARAWRRRASVWLAVAEVVHRPRAAVRHRRGHRRPLGLGGLGAGRRPRRPVAAAVLAGARARRWSGRRSRCCWRCC